MSTPLVLPAELTIYVVGELREPWLAWLEATVADGDDATADGRLVEEVDAAGLQCLLALARSLQARRLALRIDQPSAALLQACRRLGAEHLLTQPEGAPA